MTEQVIHEQLIEVFKVFLTAATILFTAIGLAKTEGLKLGISTIGFGMSLVWLYWVFRWKGLADLDRQAVSLVAVVFAVVSLCSAIAHFRLWRKPPADDSKKPATIIIKGYIEELKA